MYFLKISRINLVEIYNENVFLLNISTKSYQNMQQKYILLCSLTKKFEINNIDMFNCLCCVIRGSEDVLLEYRRELASIARFCLLLVFPLYQKN